MSTLDISDTQENISPNITMNVEDEPEVAADEVAEVAEPEVAADEVPADEVPEVAADEVAEVVEPEVAEPEVAEPEVVEPEVAEPEVVEPEVAEPEVADEVEDDFDEYLKSIGLENFINKFKENGYNSVESLKNINTSDIRKISKNIKEFKYINRRL